MANITAADVSKLRQQTGAGMMDCKNALVESNGDFQQAIDFLRKKGQKVADKRSDRDATEGCVISKVNAEKNFGVVVMLNCETDFVAKNADFVAFTTSIADLALVKKPATLEELLNLNMADGRPVKDNVTDQVGRIGEKIELSVYNFIDAPMTFSYIHPGNRLATVMGLNKADEAFAIPGKEVNMQIAAMAPVALDKDQVSAETIQREIEIGKEQARQEGKPEEMLEKIALGKLNKFYKEMTLLNQDFVRDNKVSVGQFLKSIDKDLTVTGFYRISL
jgi:elongation factor Ts